MKKFLIFSQEKLSQFSGTFLIFQERYFQNPGITELSYISGKLYSEHQHDETFLYFRKGIFRTLAYLDLETYSESWYIHNPAIRELSYIQGEVYSEPQHIQGLFNSYVTHRRVRGGWVSTFFVMLCDGKQGGEWYFMKGSNVTVKKIIKPFFVLLYTTVKRSGFH